MKDMNEMIKLNDVHYHYPDKHHALKGVSFTIREGESVGMVGANGAGKSTLLSMLVGVLFPSQGNVYIDSTEVNKKTLAHIRQRTGMVFQDADDQLFMTTVYDDVAFGPRNYQLSEDEVEKRVMEALETVGILHLKDRPPYRLSGGEKRSAAIASVLAMHPSILIMDEPTAALDPKSRRRLIRLLQSFPQTKLIATHDLDMVLELCERTIILRDGMVIKDGPTMELLTDAALMEECGLELPLNVQSCLVCGQRK